MYIPSKAQIEKSFRKDVTLDSWRKKVPLENPFEISEEKKPLLEYFVKLARIYGREREKKIAGIKDLKMLRARANETKKIIRKIQGLPNLKKTPLNPVITGHFYKRDLYKVENIYFESRPGLLVTANLYIPLNRMPPFPGVLFCQGHAGNGKSSPKYQHYCAALAVNGMAVLNFDCAGQGERDEYIDIKTGKRTIERACIMHGAAGNPMYLTGDNFGGYRLWDAIRALDYLESREEVDTKNLGALGMSGGGWEVLWLSALDKRLKAVSSGVYTTTMARRMEERHRDPEADPEQDPFGFLSNGIDIADIITASAPAAVSLAIMDQDFFPLDGALKTCREVKQVYKKCGIPEKIDAKVFKGRHGLSLPERIEYCVSWMSRWLCRENKAVLPVYEPECENRVFATKSGIVLKSLRGKTTAELNALYARELAGKRKQMGREELRKKLASLVGLNSKLEIRNSKNKIKLEKNVNGIAISKLTIKTEGGLSASAMIYENTKKKNGRALILVGNNEHASCKKLSAKGTTVVCVTPVGMEPFEEIYMDFVPLTEADLAYDAFLVGKTLSGMRVKNILRLVDLLFIAGYRDITVHGEGYGALLALFAAAIDERITTLVEKKGLFSLSSLCFNREYDYPVSFIIPGILKFMDLPEIRESILPREVILDTPLDHLKKPLSLPALKKLI